jgi:hypothetical protein
MGELGDMRQGDGKGIGKGRTSGQYEMLVFCHIPNERLTYLTGWSGPSDTTSNWEMDAG